MSFTSTVMERFDSFESTTIHTPVDLPESGGIRSSTGSIIAGCLPRPMFEGRALDYGQAEAPQAVADTQKSGLLASPLPVSTAQDQTSSLPSSAQNMAHEGYVVFQGDRTGRRFMCCREIGGSGFKDTIGGMLEIDLTEQVLIDLRAYYDDPTIRQINQAELDWEAQCKRESLDRQQQMGNGGMPAIASSQNGSQKRKFDEMDVEDEESQMASTSSAADSPQQGFSGLTHK